MKNDLYKTIAHTLCASVNTVIAMYLARIFHPVRKKRVWLRTTSFQEHWCMLGRQLCIIFFFQTQLPLTPLFISVPGAALPGFIRALIV